MKKTLPAAVSFALLLIAAVSANAQPSPPNQFFGSVTINGAAAPDGVLVEARISGQFVAGTTTAGGGYGYSPNIFYVTDPNGNREGQTIEFYVQNVKAGQAIFHLGESTQLDLSVTIANPPPSGPSGGGSSPGGGTIVGGTTNQSKQTGPCAEDWICTDWTECSNSVQKRVCADVNRCGTNTSKPIERQDCVMPVICQANATKCEDGRMFKCIPSGTEWMETQICEKGCFLDVCAGSGPFTGLFLMESGSWLYVAIIGLVIIAAIAGLWYFTGKRKAGKPSAGK